MALWVFIEKFFLSIIFFMLINYQVKSSLRKYTEVKTESDYAFVVKKDLDPYE